jgi:hypothetical protein
MILWLAVYFLIIYCILIDKEVISYQTYPHVPASRPYLPLLRWSANYPTSSHRYRHFPGQVFATTSNREVDIIFDLPKAPDESLVSLNGYPEEEEGSGQPHPVMTDEAMSREIYRSCMYTLSRYETYTNIKSKAIFIRKRMFNLTTILYQDSQQRITSRRLFRIRDVEAALNLIASIPFKYWNDVIFNRFVVLHLKHRCDDKFIDFLRQAVKHDESIRETSPIDMLYSPLAIYNIVKKLTDRNMIDEANYFFSLSDIYDDDHQASHAKEVNRRQYRAVLSNSLLSIRMKASSSDKASILEHYQSMKAKNTSTIIAIMTMMKHFSATGDLQVCESLWKDIKELPPDSESSTKDPEKAYSIIKSHLVRCYMIAGRLDLAVNLIRKLYREESASLENLLVQVSMMMYNIASYRFSAENLLKLIYAMMHPSADISINWSIHKPSSIDIHYTNKSPHDIDLRDFIPLSYNSRKELGEDDDQEMGSKDGLYDPYASLLNSYYDNKQYDMVISLFLHPALLTTNTASSAAVVKANKVWIKGPEAQAVREIMSSEPPNFSSLHLESSTRAFNLFISAINQKVSSQSSAASTVEHDLLIDFTSQLLEARMQADKSKVDQLSLSLTFRLLIDLNHLDAAHQLWRSIKKSELIASHYLKAFSSSSDESLLRQTFPITSLRGRRKQHGEDDDKQEGLEMLIAGGESFPVDLSFRFLDDLNRAYLSCAGLPAAIDLCQHILQLYNQELSNNKKQPLKLFGAYPISNMLIYYERSWRSINLDTSYDRSIASSSMNRRSIFYEADQLIKILVHSRPRARDRTRGQAHQAADQAIYQEIADWATIAASLLSRGLWSSAAEIFQSLDTHLISTSPSMSSSFIVSQTIKLAILSAMDGSFPMLIASAAKTHPRVISLSSASASATSGIGRTVVEPSRSFSQILASIPREELFTRGDRRLTCGAVDIIAFFESCQASTSSSASKPGLAYQLPIAVSLVEALFLEMISLKRFDDARRVMKLLAKARLIIDINPAYLLTEDTSSSGNSNSSSSMSSMSMVETTRVRLAQKWAAQLLGKSLNQLTSDVAGSIARAAASKQPAS